MASLSLTALLANVLNASIPVLEAAPAPAADPTQSAFASLLDGVREQENGPETPRDKKDQESAEAAADGIPSPMPVPLTPQQLLLPQTAMVLALAAPAQAAASIDGSVPHEAMPAQGLPQETVAREPKTPKKGQSERSEPAPFEEPLNEQGVAVVPAATPQPQVAAVVSRPEAPHTGTHATKVRADAAAGEQGAAPDWALPPPPHSIPEVPDASHLQEALRKAVTDTAREQDSAPAEQPSNQTIPVTPAPAMPPASELPQAATPQPPPGQPAPPTRPASEARPPASAVAQDPGPMQATALSAAAPVPKLEIAFTARLVEKGADSVKLPGATAASAGVKEAEAPAREIPQRQELLKADPAPQSGAAAAVRHATEEVPRAEPVSPALYQEDPRSREQTHPETLMGSPSTVPFTAPQMADGRPAPSSPAARPATPPPSVPQPHPATETTPLPVKNISFQHEDVTVRITDRSGALHVAVSTPDANTARSLQSALPDLVAGLDKRGFQAETWPQTSTGSAQDQWMGEHKSPAGATFSGASQPDTQDGHGRGRQNQPDWWERAPRRNATIFSLQEEEQPS